MNNLNKIQSHQTAPLNSHIHEEKTTALTTRFETDSKLTKKSGTKKKNMIVPRNAFAPTHNNSISINPDLNQLKTPKKQDNTISLKTFGVERETCFKIRYISNQSQCGSYFSLIQNVVFYLHEKCEELIIKEKETINFDLVNSWILDFENQLLLASNTALVHGSIKKLKNIDDCIDDYLKDQPFLKNPENVLAKAETTLEYIKNEIEGEDFKAAFIEKFSKFKGSHEPRLKQARENLIKIIKELNMGIDILFDLFQLSSNQYATIAYTPSSGFTEWDSPQIKNTDLMHKEFTSIKKFMKKNFIRLDSLMVDSSIKLNHCESQINHLLEGLNFNHSSEKKIPMFFSQATENRSFLNIYENSALEEFKKEIYLNLKEQELNKGNLQNGQVKNPSCIFNPEIKSIFGVLQLFCKKRDIEMVAIESGKLQSIRTPKETFEPSFLALINYCHCQFQNDFLLTVENIVLDQLKHFFAFHHSDVAATKLKIGLEMLDSLFQEGLLKLVPIFGNSLKEKLLSIDTLDNSTFSLIDEYIETIRAFAYQLNSYFDEETKGFLEGFLNDIESSNKTDTTWFLFKENELKNVHTPAVQFYNQMKKLNSSINTELLSSLLNTDDIMHLKKSVSEFKIEISNLLHPLLELPIAIEQLITVSALKKLMSKTNKILAVNKDIGELCDFNYTKLLKAVPRLIMQSSVDEEKTLHITLPVVEEVIPNIITPSLIKEPILEDVQKPLQVLPKERKEIELTPQEDVEPRNDQPPSKKHKELVSYLIKQGWIPKSQNSSHVKFFKENQTLIVPIHKKNPELKTGTFHGILRQKAEKEELIISNNIDHKS